jgi:ATP-binding protein involved in chromosome partitioning
VGVVAQRLQGVARIFPVTGGKGGIGKSMTASLLALLLADRGRRVGLFDLDFTGPCDHLVLGIDESFPKEEFGVEPPERYGLRFMSVSIFSGSTAAPFRGVDLTNALLELLAITRWGELDALVLDMPPGLGDIALDAVRLIDRAEYLVVANASRLVIENVRRNLDLLRELKLDVAGVVENMRHVESESVRALADSYEHRYLGAVPFDPSLEQAIGDVDRLKRTVAAVAVGGIIDGLGL